MTELAQPEHKSDEDVSKKPSDGDATNTTLAIISLILGIIGIGVSVAGLPGNRLAYIAATLVVALPGVTYYSFPRIRKWKRLNLALIIITTLALLAADIAFFGRQSNRCCVPPPVPTVSITAPKSTVDCRASGPQCRFTVAGRSAGAGSDLQIFVLVYPVNPPGGGWYVESPPASIGGNGAWDQAPSYVGSAATPARNGDKLQIEAVVVHTGATYNGTLLSDMASGATIKDPRQINGLASQSDIVFLRVLG
jgi:hypothetical protein